MLTARDNDCDIDVIIMLAARAIVDYFQLSSATTNDADSELSFTIKWSLRFSHKWDCQIKMDRKGSRPRKAVKRKSVQSLFALSQRHNHGRLVDLWFD